MELNNDYSHSSDKESTEHFHQNRMEKELGQDAIYYGSEVITMFREQLKEIKSFSEYERKMHLQEIKTTLFDYLVKSSRVYNAIEDPYKKIYKDELLKIFQME